LDPGTQRNLMFAWGFGLAPSRASTRPDLRRCLGCCGMSSLIRSGSSVLVLLRCGPGKRLRPVPPSCLHPQRRVVLFPWCRCWRFVARCAPPAGPGPRRQPVPGMYPVKEVADIPQACKLFNSYTLGGFVILQRPDVLVSVDFATTFMEPRGSAPRRRRCMGKGKCLAASPKPGAYWFLRLALWARASTQTRRGS